MFKAQSLHQVRQVAELELVCISSLRGITIERALGQQYIFVDWGLSFGLDHRRAFPDAQEASVRVSQAKMAIEYLYAIGGSAYLPKRLVQKDIEAGLLHEVKGAPVFVRQAYATFPVRAPRLDLIEKSLLLVTPN